MLNIKDVKMAIIGNLLKKIFGISVAEPINAAKGLIKSLYLTNAQKSQYRNTLDQLQGQISLIEAVHPSRFVAGARAALIWICAISLALYWLPQYSLGAYFWIKICLIKQAMLPFPLDATKLFELIGSLLGLGVIHKITK